MRHALSRRPSATVSNQKHGRLRVTLAGRLACHCGPDAPRHRTPLRPAPNYLLPLLALTSSVARSAKVLCATAAAPAPASTGLLPAPPLAGAAACWCWCWCWC
jgi:hypothetical protein